MADEKYILRQAVFCIGDSISTLEGYNPKGYKIFYNGDNCTKSGILHASDTWWRSNRGRINI